MNINSINNITPYTNVSAKANYAKSSETASSKNSKAAVYEKSKEEASLTASETIEKIKTETASKTKALRDIVAKIIGRQSNAYNSFLELGTKKDWENIINNYEIDQDTIEAAKEAVSEDGYFGVKKTTERIMDFAKALSGGDPSKIGILKDAVKKGFKKAEEVWGGELPEISQKTYDAVMEEFSKWESEALLS